jgi:hypothetical protein
VRKITAISFTLFVVVFGLAIVGSDLETSGDNHSLHQPNQKQTPTVDGALNPSAIPDFAAYEVVFRLLSSESSNDPQGIRKRAYTALSGFGDAEGAALLNAAYEYKRHIESLDAEVLAIKDATWPNPTREVMDKLTELQRQKELIIESVATRLQTQLANYDARKLSRHIREKVKRGIKAFGTELPVKKPGSIGLRVHSMFTVSASQAGGCDSYVYVYSSTNVDITNAVVYGYGSYSEGYNSCGHTYTPSTVLYGPGGAYSSDGILYLEVSPDTFIDGFFSSTTDVEGFCPIVSSTYPSGSNSSNTTAAPYITVKPFESWSDSTRSVGQTAGIATRIIGSQNATGSFGIEFGYDVVGAGAPTISISGSSSSVPISGGATVVKVGLYTPTFVAINPTRIKATAVVSCTCMVRNPNITSTGILTLTP